MAGRGRADVHERFLRVVRRGLERAEREAREELARIRPRRRMTPAEVVRAQGPGALPPSRQPGPGAQRLVVGCPPGRVTRPPLAKSARTAHIYDSTISAEARLRPFAASPAVEGLNFV